MFRVIGEGRVWFYSFGLRRLSLHLLLLSFRFFFIVHSLVLNAIPTIICASNRTNLTASGPRPNPQGSYHYGLINTTKTIRLANSAGLINGKQRYAVNSVSFVPADTP